MLCYSRYWDTTYLKEFTVPEGSVFSEQEPIHADWFEMDEKTREAIYIRNYNFVGVEG